jgi:RNA recognition motif-containing protein
VEFKTKTEAILAQRALDKKELMGRKLMVRFAEERVCYVAFIDSVTYLTRWYG